MENTNEVPQNPSVAIQERETSIFEELQGLPPAPVTAKVIIAPKPPPHEVDEFEYKSFYLKKIRKLMQTHTGLGKMTPSCCMVMAKTLDMFMVDVVK